MQTRLLADGLFNPAVSWATGTQEEATSKIGAIIGAIMGAIFIFSFILAMFYLIIGGVRWVTSGGDKAQLESARDQIVHALLGLVIIAAVWAIMILLSKFLGLSFPDISLPTIPDIIGG